MQGNDNRTISEIMDVLAQPQVVKTQVIATWLQAHWVNKSVNKSQLSLNQKQPQKATASKKPAKSSQMRSGLPAKKPVVVIKKK